MLRYWPASHGAELLQHWFSVSPSLLLYPPTTRTVLPCNQSVVSTWKPLAVYRMELLVGCPPVQNLDFVIPRMLWLPSSPFVSTPSTLQGLPRSPH